MSVVSLTALKAKYQTGDFPTEQDFIDLIDTLANSSTSVYTRYIALLTQTGTNAPVATVLENTVGTVGTGYIAPGAYTITSAGLFTLNKTFIIIKNRQIGIDISSVPGADFEATWESTSEITISTFNIDTVVGANGLLEKTEIEIRVYP